MRSGDGQQAGMFSYVSPERRIPADHPCGRSGRWPTRCCGTSRPGSRRSACFASAASRPRPRGLDVHLHRGGLQSGAPAEPPRGRRM